jgi:hypothetical protein
MFVRDFEHMNKNGKWSMRDDYYGQRLGDESLYWIPHDTEQATELVVSGVLLRSNQLSEIDKTQI